jgi:hypothetical protein
VNIAAEMTVAEEKDRLKYERKNRFVTKYTFSEGLTGREYQLFQIKGTQT